jgi:hypothetical protein
MAKCPYKDSNNFEQRHGNKSFSKGNKVSIKHKSFFINEEVFSIDDKDQDISGDERGKVVFMDMDTTKDDVKMNFRNNDDEGGLVEDFPYTDKDINRLKKIIVDEVKAKENLSKNLEKMEKMIIDLEIQVEEAKRIEEFLTEIFLSRDKDYEKLEAKIVSLRKDLDTENCQQKINFGKSTKILKHIIEIQMSLHIKTGIGFSIEEQGNLVACEAY